MKAPFLSTLAFARQKNLQKPLGISHFYGLKITNNQQFGDQFHQPTSSFFSCSFLGSIPEFWLQNCGGSTFSMAHSVFITRLGDILNKVRSHAGSVRGHPGVTPCFGWGNTSLMNKIHYTLTKRVRNNTHIWSGGLNIYDYSLFWCEQHGFTKLLI